MWNLAPIFCFCKNKKKTSSKKIGNVLPWEDIIDEAERLLDISRDDRNAAKEGHNDNELENDQKGNEMEQTHIQLITKSYLDEGGLILLKSTGTTRSFMCRNSSVCRINDEIAGRGGNLDQST